MKQRAPGKLLLLVTGIIHTCIGVFGIVGVFIILNIVRQMQEGTLEEAAQQIYDSRGVTAEMLQATVATSVFQGLVLILAGICGIVFCNKVQKYKICFLLGILMIVYHLIVAGIGAVTGGFTVLTLISIVLNLILPVLYFWGAVKNRQEALEQAEK